MFYCRRQQGIYLQFQYLQCFLSLHFMVVGVFLIWFKFIGPWGVAISKMVRKLATFLCYLEDNCMEEMECDELLESGNNWKAYHHLCMFVITCLISLFLKISFLYCFMQSPWKDHARKWRIWPSFILFLVCCSIR